MVPLSSVSKDTTTTDHVPATGTYSVLVVANFQFLLEEKREKERKKEREKGRKKDKGS